jgi:hypothetical protein
MADSSTENRRLAECEQQSLAELTCRDHDGVFFHLQCKSVELEQGNSTLVWELGQLEHETFYGCLQSV